VTIIDKCDYGTISL